jgi:hypothetical protein
MPRIHIQTQCSKEELEKVKEQMDQALEHTI